MPSILPAVYEYGTQVIDFFQVTGFVFTIPTLNWPSMGGLVDFFRFIQAALNGVGWSAWFWIATSLVIVYFAIMVALPLAGVDCGDLLEEFAYWIGHFFFTGILFIPIMRVLIENYVCDVPIEGGKPVLTRDSTTVCWEGVHIAYVIFGTIALIMLLLGWGIKAKSMDDAIHDPKKRMAAKEHIRYLDSKYTFYRLIMIIVSVALRNDGVNGAVVFFILSFLPFFYILLRLPHTKASSNWLMGAKYLGNWWTFIVALILATDLNAGTPVTAGYLLLVTPVFVAIGVVLIILRQKLCPPKGMNWNDVQWQNISDSSDNQLTQTKHDKEKAMREFEILSDQAFQVFLKQWEKDQSCETPTKCLVIQGPRSDFPLDKQLLSVGALKHLITLIEQNKVLTDLKIRHEKLIGPDIEICGGIAAALETHPTLEHVQIWSCAVNDESALLIAQAVLKNPNIQQLDLGDNAVNAPAAQKIKDMIRSAEGRQLVFECF